MIQHVLVFGDLTFSYSGACVKVIALTTPELIETHNSASAVVFRVGTVDLMISQRDSESLRGSWAVCCAQESSERSSLAHRIPHVLVMLAMQVPSQTSSGFCLVALVCLSIFPYAT